MRCQIVVSENDVLIPALRPDWTVGGIQIIIIINTRTVSTTHNGATCDIITHDL